MIEKEVLKKLHISEDDFQDSSSYDQTDPDVKEEVVYDYEKESDHNQGNPYQK